MNWLTLGILIVFALGCLTSCHDYLRRLAGHERTLTKDPVSLAISLVITTALLVGILVSIYLEVVP